MGWIIYSCQFAVVLQNAATRGNAPGVQRAVCYFVQLHESLEQSQEQCQPKISMFEIMIKDKAQVLMLIQVCELVTSPVGADGILHASQQKH